VKFRPISIAFCLLLTGCTTPQKREVGSIFDAITEDRPDLVLALAKSSRDIVNSRWNMNPGGWLFEPTPLQYAAMLGRNRICEILVAYGATLHPRAEPEKSTGIYGRSPLAIACDQRKMETALLLIKLGSDVNHRDDEGNTALMDSCFGGHPLNVMTEDGMEFQRQHEKVAEPFVRLLLNNGANPLLKNNWGQSARDQALQCGFHEIVKILDSASANPPK
jgi:ankyrin repeat protein